MMFGGLGIQSQCYAEGGRIVQCESCSCRCSNFSRIHSVWTLQRRAGALCVSVGECVRVFDMIKTLMHCLRKPWCRRRVCLFCSKGQINWLLINLDCYNHSDWDAIITLSSLTLIVFFAAAREARRLSEAHRFRSDWWKPDQMFPSLSVPSKLTGGEAVGIFFFFSFFLQ